MKKSPNRTAQLERKIHSGRHHRETRKTTSPSKSKLSPPMQGVINITFRGEETPLQFSVFFHLSVVHLRLWVKKHRSHLLWENAASGVDPFERTSFSSKGEIKSSNCGEIHLLQDLKQGVLTHESVHAGLEVFRRVRGSVWLDDECNEDEEDLAYVIGDIARELVNLHNELML